MQWEEDSALNCVCLGAVSRVEGAVDVVCVSGAVLHVVGAVGVV